ncbi:MAG: methylated-DNA--[protein]-cysteine S-methyltransferase [Planctomycetales bacterium]|nr:methylated-DNA--[protein]-cysteine S-methyltransferase [Planctomycetales bacterium]
MEARSTAAVAFETRLGWMAIARRGDSVAGLTIGHGGPAAAWKAIREMLGEVDEELAESDPLIADLKAYAAGEPVSFDGVPLDVKHLTSFQRRVVRQCRRVDYSETLSYKQLAQRAGSPGAARAVGNTMAKNRFPIIVPCHRIVGSAGALGGFSAPQGISLKRRMLDMEAAAAPALLPS